MFEFLKIQRKEGNLTDEQLDLFLGFYINQEQYDELKAIKPVK